MQNYSILDTMQNQRFLQPVTFLKGFSPKPIGNGTLADLLKSMMQPADRVKILALRASKKENPDQYDKDKKQLKGFMIGNWSYRENQRGNCQQYVPYLVFDFDSVPVDQIPVLQEKLSQCPYVLASFYSPAGLRCIVEADTNLDTHESTYKMVLEYLSRQTVLPIGKKADKGGGHIDPSTCDPSRFWYFVEGLTENEIYVNAESLVFDALEATQRNIMTQSAKAPQNKKERTQAKNKAVALTDADRWELYEQMTDERNSTTADAGRNGRILYLAQLAHEHGETQSDILAYCLQFTEPGFDEKEIKATVESAVKRTKSGKFSFENLLHYKTKRNAPINGAPNTDTKKEADKTDEGNAYNRMVKHLQSNYEFQLDIVGNEQEYRKKGASKWVVLNENDLLHTLRSKGYKVNDTLLMSLLGSEFVPRFDPFLTYFKNLPKHDPNSGSHIDTLCTYVQLKDEDKDREWFNKMFKKTLVRVAASATMHISFNKQCFVFKSGQNDGKSTFIRWLCPPSLSKYRVDWTREEVGEKDGRFALAQNLLINLDELATFGKANIEQTKALMSLDHIKDRPPYGKRPIRFPRRASFFGSTNKDEFLTDESGSVRWLVFDIAGIRHDNGGPNGYGKQIDIDAVWAEAWYLLQTGQIEPQLTRDEIAESEQRNRSFQVTTPEMELVMQHFVKTKEEDDGGEFLSVTEITNYLQGLTTLRLNRNYVGSALIKLGWEKSKRFDKTKNFSTNGYWCKKWTSKQSDFE